MWSSLRAGWLAGSSERAFARMIAHLHVLALTVPAPVSSQRELPRNEVLRRSLDHFRTACRYGQPRRRVRTILGKSSSLASRP